MTRPNDNDPGDEDSGANASSRPGGSQSGPAQGKGDRPANLGELESLLAETGGSRSLAHFSILGEVGRGGMGTVFRARDMLLDRQVAVKVLAEELNRTPEFQERFVREAKIIARMTHPNIPQIHFIGRAEGHLFFAMEWIDGQTVESLIADGPLPPAKALDIAMQTAEALRAAHLAGIVHRDIKPSNLIVTHEGVVKVLDFGIARSAAFTGTATVAGSFLGTPHYASPEQARGLTVDARSDIYSLGATLFELLSGRRPFEGDNALVVLTSRLFEAAPSLPESVPPEIRTVVARMLATKAEDRYSDVDALLEALRAASPVPPVPARLAKRAMAFLVDLFIVGAPLVALFVGFWAVKGYYITTPLYDSVAGRILLGAGLFAWFSVCFVLIGRRRGATIGQRLQGILVVSRNREQLPLRSIVVRTVIWWGPVCLAMALQPDWPPALRSLPSGAEEDAAISNLPFVIAQLWIISLGFMTLLHGRRNLADWLSRTEVVERPASDARRRPPSEMRSSWRVRLWTVLRRPRFVLNAAILLVWLAAAAFVGSEMRDAIPWNPTRIYNRHTMFEKIEPGDPGWNRLCKRFLHEFLRPGDSARNPEALYFERHPILPFLVGNTDTLLNVENSLYGAVLHYDVDWTWAMHGSREFGGTAQWSCDELQAVSEEQASQWDESRRRIYRGSVAHFFRALMHQRLKEEGFAVLNAEAFVGLFRRGDVFILVAWPELRVRGPGGEERGLRLYQGYGWVSPHGNFGGSVAHWGGEDLPNSVLSAYSEEQDRAWGKTTASIHQVLTLE